MISEAMRQFIESTHLVFVASADAEGNPHVAAGSHPAVSNGSLLVFENWFCPVTLYNITRNTHVAVVVARSGIGGAAISSSAGLSSRTTIRS